MNCLKYIKKLVVEVLIVGILIIPLISAAAIGSSKNQEEVTTSDQDISREADVSDTSAAQQDGLIAILLIGAALSIFAVYSKDSI